MATGGTNQWLHALEGRVLAGKYRLIRARGAGGMGAVFEAEQPGLGRRVAVKLVLPGRQAGELTVQRFAVEARAAARVADGGVPQVYDFDYDAELGPFQVLELLDGESLEARLARGPLTPSATYAVLLETLGVLARVHAAGIVHRDIKPGNVFLEQRADGARRVRLLDFGVARVREPNAPRLTQQGTLLGTLGYLAPEALERHDVDHRADLYSVGMLLWTCLTAQEPFPGTPAPGVVAAVAAGRVPSLRRARPELSERLQRVYEWATARAPEARPASADALATELRRAQLDESPDALASSGPPAEAVAPPRAAAPTWVSGEHEGPGAAATPAPSVHAPSAPRATGAGPRVGSVAAVAPPPSRAGRRWVLPAALAAAGCALAVMGVTLAYVLTHRAGVARPTPASPAATVAAPDAGPVSPSLAPEPPDRALEGARADLATARAALAQGRFDAALAALETARGALMDPAPAAGSPRATTLAEVYLASGDVYRARAPTRVGPKVPGAGVTEFFECANAVRDDQYAALAAYNAVMLDPRFGDQGECAPAHVGALYDMLVATCGTTPDARRQYLGNAVLYYRMADRPGPCARDAAAGLARALAMQRDLGP